MACSFKMGIKISGELLFVFQHHIFKEFYIVRKEALVKREPVKGAKVF